MPISPLVLNFDDFIAAPCIDCDVPGYFVLQPRQSVTAFEQLSIEARQNLGPAIARLEAAIRAVTQAEHIYVLRFSEGLASVHFHLFPRTAELASLWIAETQPTVPGINGPQLFAWARIRYHVPSPESLSTHTLDTAKAICATLPAETDSLNL